MKKMKMLILTMVLTLAMGAQAMAAPSAGGVTSGNVNGVSESLSKELEEAGKSTENLKVVVTGTEVNVTKEEALKMLQKSNDCNVFMMDVSLVLDDEYFALSEGHSVDVKLTMAGIKADSEVVVRHMKEDDTWETLTIKEVGEGYVVTTFTSFSPVAVVVGKTVENNQTSSTDDKKNETSTENDQTSATAPTSTPAQTTTAQTTTASPKTAETNRIVAVEMMAVAAFAGMIIFGKKARA